MRGWMHRALLSCKVIGDPNSRPRWRENVSERFWYQIREGKLYRNMTPGSQAQCLDVVEIREGGTVKEEILDNARAVIVLHDGGVEVLYAGSAKEAKRWQDAVADAATDEHRIPADEAGLKLWLLSAASEVKETGEVPAWCLAAMDEEQCGIERMVRSAEGATLLHLACCYTGNCQKLLQAISDRSEVVRSLSDDGGSLPIHTLITFYPESAASIRWMAHVCKEDLLKTDNVGMTPLHRLVRWFKPEESNRCVESLVRLVEACPQACEAADARGRLPAHILARHHPAMLHPLRLLVWKFPKAAATPTAQGWLPVHYVARYHGKSTDSIRFLLGIAPSTLYARTGSGWLAVHHVCRYGASAETLSLLLLPATSLCTTPNGYTPLHLLARYQAADAHILQHCLDCQHQAIKVQCRDGMLPLHLVVAYQGSCDASIRLLLNAYPEAAVKPSAGGVIPLQLVTAECKMSWGTRRMLENASLQVQQNAEESLKREVRKDVLYDPERDALHDAAASTKVAPSRGNTAEPLAKGLRESLGVGRDWWKKDGRALKQRNHDRPSEPVRPSSGPAENMTESLQISSAERSSKAGVEELAPQRKTANVDRAKTPSGRKGTRRGQNRHKEEATAVPGPPSTLSALLGVVDSSAAADEDESNAQGELRNEGASQDVSRAGSAEVGQDDGDEDGGGDDEHDQQSIVEKRQELETSLKEWKRSYLDHEGGGASPAHRLKAKHEGLPKPSGSKAGSVDTSLHSLGTLFPDGFHSWDFGHSPRIAPSNARPSSGAAPDAPPRGEAAEVPLGRAPTDDESRPQAKAATARQGASEAQTTHQTPEADPTSDSMSRPSTDPAVLPVRRVGRRSVSRSAEERAARRSGGDAEMVEKSAAVAVRASRETRVEQAKIDQKIRLYKAYGAKASLRKVLEASERHKKPPQPTKSRPGSAATSRALAKGQNGSKPAVNGTSQPKHKSVQAGTDSAESAKAESSGVHEVIVERVVEKLVPVEVERVVVKEVVREVFVRGASPEREERARGASAEAGRSPGQQSPERGEGRRRRAGMATRIRESTEAEEDGEREAAAGESEDAKGRTEKEQQEHGARQQAEEGVEAGCVAKGRRRRRRAGQSGREEEEKTRWGWVVGESVREEVLRVRAAEAERRRREAEAAAEVREAEAAEAAEALQECMERVRGGMAQREGELRGRLQGTGEGSVPPALQREGEGESEAKGQRGGGGGSVREKVQGAKAEAERMELWGRRLAVMEETVEAKETLEAMQRVDKEREAARLEEESWKEGVVNLMLHSTEQLPDSDGWSLSTLDEDARLDEDSCDDWGHIAELQSQ